MENERSRERTGRRRRASKRASRRSVCPRPPTGRDHDRRPPLPRVPGVTLGRLRFDRPPLDFCESPSTPGNIKVNVNCTGVSQTSYALRTVGRSSSAAGPPYPNERTDSFIIIMLIIVVVIARTYRCSIVFSLPLFSIFTRPTNIVLLVRALAGCRMKAESYSNVLNKKAIEDMWK